jgi:hypothetical protein
VTTEKDWVKLLPLIGGNPLISRRRDLPIWRLDLAIQFFQGDQERLVEQIQTIASSSPQPA